MKYSDDLLNYTLTDVEKQKQARFAEEFTAQYAKTGGNLEELSVYDFKLTENLLPDDLRQICLAEDELSRSGSFIRLFPSKISESYLSYFATPFYRNYLLVEWERRYGDRRTEGKFDFLKIEWSFFNLILILTFSHRLAIAYLQQLCKQKLNLMGNRGRDREAEPVISDESDGQ